MLIYPICIDVNQYASSLNGGVKNVFESLPCQPLAMLAQRPLTPSKYLSLRRPTIESVTLAPCQAGARVEPRRQPTVDHAGDDGRVPDAEHRVDRRRRIPAFNPASPRPDASDERSCQDDAGRAGALQDAVGRLQAANPLAGPITPPMGLFVPPAAVPEVQDHAPMRPAAGLAPTLGPPEPDRGRQLEPVDGDKASGGAGGWAWDVLGPTFGGT